MAPGVDKCLNGNDESVEVWCVPSATRCHVVIEVKMKFSVSCSVTFFKFLCISISGVKDSVTLCYSVLLFFVCVLYCSLFLYCTVSACDVRAATTNLAFSVFFPQLLGKCQGITRKEVARPAHRKYLIFFIVMCV
jgi:hypothetical protein